MDTEKNTKIYLAICDLISAYRKQALGYVKKDNFSQAAMLFGDLADFQKIAFLVRANYLQAAKNTYDMLETNPREDVYKAIKAIDPQFFSFHF